MRTVDVSKRDHYKNAVFPSPFHSRQKEHNQMKEWSRWADYLSVPAYWSESMEYFAGRNACGVFDITPMVKHLVTGPDAMPYLNRLMTRDVSKIKPGRVGYSVWCNEQGRVIDDGTIFHLKEGVYRVCSQEHQIDWFLTNTLGFDVSVVEDTHDVAGLALQGPTSCAVLKDMGLNGIENLTPFGLTYFEFEGTELMISRTGFTGDLGYELWIDPEHAEVLWDRLFAAGELRGIRAMGSDALELLRIEAGFHPGRRGLSACNGSGAAHPHTFTFRTRPGLAGQFREGRIQWSPGVAGRKNAGFALPPGETGHRRQQTGEPVLRLHQGQEIRRHGHLRHVVAFRQGQYRAGVAGCPTGQAG